METMNAYESLRGYLFEQGHSETEVEGILAKLVEYDRRILRDSIFDSIEDGSFNLEDLVRDVTEQDATSSETVAS